MGSRNNKSGHTHQGSLNGMPNSTQDNKYAKYAGATSNKSKRNYADLRLVRPEDLKEYASENARPGSGQSSGTPNGQDRKRSADGQSSRRKAAAKQPAKFDTYSRKSTAPKSVRSPQRKLGQNTNNTNDIPSNVRTVSTANRGRTKDNGSDGLFQSVSSDARQNAAGKPQNQKASRRNKAVKPAKSASASRTPKAPQYVEDEYSKALNNSDFYGLLVEKYYIKYPEKQEERKSASGSSASYTPPRQRRRIKPNNDGGAGKPEKSIAELAVKNRGTPVKKKYAKVVKNGRATGSVPIGPVHRKVHRRDRRHSMFVGAVAVTSAALVMFSVVFFVFFRVDKIEVAGDTPYSADRITELCRFNKGDNIMFIDTATSEQQVVDTLPYVESCEIKRSAPNIVKVNVTCANTLGVIEKSNGFWSIVSTSGKILENITNVATVSSSDILTLVSYEPDIHTVDELAAARRLPVLDGLEFKNFKVGELVNDSSVEILKGLVMISDQADDFGMPLTKLKYTGRGYEAEYDGRINIVLGDTNDQSIIKKRIEIANHIICVTGDISQHDMGEITYIKNQTFFNPEYEISQDEIAKHSRKDKSETERIVGFGEALLNGGVDELDKQVERAKSESSRTDNVAKFSTITGITDEPQAA